MQSCRSVPLSAAARVALILILALTLFGTSPALARGNSLDPVTWYVATTGADSNSCTAFDAPCQTINGAIGKAAAGDVVKVAIGYYGGTGTQTVLVDRNITFLGGWDETFSAQTGLSTVDGGKARTGIVINDGITAVIDHFAVRYGVAGNFGGGIYTRGILTLSNSIVSDNSAGWMGGGIWNFGTMTITDTTIRNNTAGDLCCSGGGGGGGIENYSGSVTLNNTTLNGNKIIGGFSGSAIDSTGIFILNNSTVSGNTGAAGIDISGSLILNNSTVTGNTGGIDNGGTTTLRNSIVAGNTSFDCYGSIASSGYNLIGRNTSCNFSASTGDKVGTTASPINPRLLPLADHGGPTFTHALLGTSPALNAGNPAAPGSDGDACLLTDQRGIARPVDGTCDMGAYEGSLPGVVSILRLDPSPTSASSVRFKVKFSDAVTGVDTAAPFADFSLTKTGILGASITSVSGSGDTYTVTVNTGRNNGTLRLNVLDNDSILDGSANPLGGPGAGNGKFMTGQTYTVKKIPAILSPAGTSTWDPTPTYKWSKIPGATQYSYQLMKGTTLVYSKIVPGSACGASACLDTPTKSLASGVYKWRVRAMTEGTWKSFSPYKSFTIIGPKAGYWKGYGVDFYVTPNQGSVDDYSIYISVSGCGNYKVTHTALVPIVNRKFAFTGSFYASGTFSSATNVSGVLGLKSYYIPGCGYVSGGPFYWSAAWLRSGQPELNDPFPQIFTVDPMQ